MKTKTKPQEKVKFVAKGKNKSAPKTKSVAKQHAKKPSPKQNSAKLVRNIEKGALAPSMDNEFITVTDKFRFGEFKDLGMTKETAAGVKQNQIFLQLPVNPRRLLAVAKLNDVLKDNVPVVYKSESYNDNSYQYRIDSAELILSGVMPTSVSGEVCAFYTSNLTRTINSENVLDAYESSKHKISVSGKQVKSLKFSTGTLFINDDPTSDMAPDPTLCFAGLLVMFIRAPVTASEAVASSSSATPDFAYLGPMVQAQLKMKCSYKGFEYAPQNINSRSIGNKYDQEMFDTVIVPSPMVITGNDDDVCVIPTFAVPPELQSSVLTTAYAQTYGGEWLGTTGDRTKPMFNLRLHNIPPSLSVGAVTIPGVLGSINLFSWSSFTGWVQSAFAKLASLPDAINQRFIDLFGDVAGNALYDVSKWIVSAGISYLSGGILGAQIGAMVGHDQTGYPIDSAGTICTGYIEPNSMLYGQVMTAFLNSGQGQYIEAVEAQGADISFMNVRLLNYYHALDGAQPYIGSSGRIGAWTKPIYGYTEVKPSFGQPTSIGTTASRPAQIQISQLASDHTTQRLGATVARPISFFGYVPSGGSAVRIMSTEATLSAPDTITPDANVTTMAALQNYYKFCDYNVTPGGYAIQQLFGHISFSSSFGASFVASTGVMKPKEVAAIHAAGPLGLSHPCSIVFQNLFGSLDVNFMLKNECPVIERSMINTAVGGAMYFHFVGFAHTQDHSLLIPVGGNSSRITKIHPLKHKDPLHRFPLTLKPPPIARLPEAYFDEEYALLGPNTRSTDKQFDQNPSNDEQFWLKGFLESKGLRCAKEIGVTCTLDHEHSPYGGEP